MLETLLFAHFIGDFVFQRDVWAKNKSKSNVALTKHLLAYTATIYFFSLFLFVPLYNSYAMAFWFSVTNGLFHWVTDYFTSRMTSALWKAGKVHDFFVVIGCDQMIHMFTALWLLRYIGVM